MQTRRDFIKTVGIGAAGAAAVGVLGTQFVAKAANAYPKVSDSVVFPRVQGDVGYVLRAHQPPYQEMVPGDYAFSVFKCDSALARINADRPDDLEDHDKLLYACCPWVRERLGDNPKEPLYHLERQANRIARDTRRGKANNVVINPDNPHAWIIENYWGGGARDVVAPMRRCWHRDWMPRNRAFVFYRGRESQSLMRDAAGVITDKGLTFPELQRSPAYNYGVGRFFAYGRVVEFA